MGDTRREPSDQAPTETSARTRSAELLAETSAVDLWCSLRGRLGVEVAAVAFDAVAEQA